MLKFFRRFLTLDQPSASDIIPRGNMEQKANRIEISLDSINVPFTRPPKVWMPSIPDTNSMDPAFDHGHNNILIAGVDQENQRILVNFLKVGDVAVYRNPQMYAIHRIITIGHDRLGRYFRFKGDNSIVRDPFKVRDSQIQWLSIGTIY